jgi:2-iminobutanoate/2-iminopropanoate deaminase
MSDFVAFNGVYGEAFGETFPARSAFEVGCLPKNVMVEIEFVAVVE